MVSVFAANVSTSPSNPIAVEIENRAKTLEYQPDHPRISRPLKNLADFIGIVLLCSFSSLPSFSLTVFVVQPKKC